MFCPLQRILHSCKRLADLDIVPEICQGPCSLLAGDRAFRRHGENMKHWLAVVVVLGLALCTVVASASPKSHLTSKSAAEGFLIQQQSDPKDQPQRFEGTIVCKNGALFCFER
jgi:hypothetical protein